MIEIGFSTSFKRVFKKRIRGNQELETKFWQKVEIFMQDPFDRTLRTHKLSGKLSDLWSFSIGYDLRVVFYFANESKVVFVDIGKHDEVY